MTRQQTTFLFLLGFFLSLAEGAIAGTQDNAKLALHAQAASPGCTPLATGCSNFVTERPLGASYVILAAGQADPVAGVSGLSFGIDYQGSSGVGIDPAYVSWTFCGDGLYFPNSGPNGTFPAPGGGILLTWSTCQTTTIGSDGAHAFAGFFYVYAYSDDVFEITENNNLGSGPELLVVDCTLGESSIPLAQVGSVGFGTTLGANPCGGAADTTPPTVTSVAAVGFPVDGSGQISTITDQIEVQFSEPVGASALVAGNYSVSNTAESVVSVASAGLASVTLTMSGSIAPSAAFYEVTVSGVMDIAGNPIITDGVDNLKAFILKQLDFQVNLNIFLATLSSPPDVFAIEGDLSPLTFALQDNALLLDPDTDGIYETSVPVSVSRNEATGVAEATLEWLASHNTEGLEPRANRSHLLTSDNGAIDVLSIYWNDETTPVVAWTDVTVGALSVGARTNGAAWGDYDDDGDEDLFVANGLSANYLLTNDGMGGFAVDSSGVVGNTFEGNGGAWADVDNDGDLDLSFVSNNFPFGLLRNDGGGTFVDIAAGPLLTTNIVLGAAWGDYDNDGDLDVFSTGYPSRLFENIGGGQFADVTPPELDVWGGVGGWGDYDNDGDLDLFMIGNTFPNKLMRNDGCSFVEDTTSPATQDAGGGVGLAWGDYDNDGDMDIFVGNFGGGSHLLRNDSGVFVEDTTSETLWDALDGGGPRFFDFDNDGDLDLYLDTYFAGSRLYRNDGGGVFVDVSTGAITYEGGGMEFADYDNDGDLDVYVPANLSPNALIRNDLTPGVNNWLQIRLRGTTGDAVGMGARVRVVSGSTSMIREVTGATNFGGHSTLIAAFGLGPGGNPDTVEVRWPSGIVEQYTNIAPNQRIELLEPISIRLTEASPFLVKAVSNATVTITGSNLDPTGATLSLFTCGGVEIPATGVNAIDSEHVEATFDLSGAAPGNYSLTFVTSGLGRRTLKDAVFLYDETVDLFRSTDQPTDDRLPVFPRPSASSTTLAFVSGDFGSSEIFVKDPLAPDATRTSLTSTDLPYYYSRIDWSPDGSEITYIGEDNLLRIIDSSLGDAAGVQTFSLSGVSPRNLAWSPSGQSVLFIQSDPSFKRYVYSLDLVSGIETQVTDHSAASGTSTIIDSYVNWSPDGSKVVFARYAFPNASIFSVPFPAGEAAGSIDTLAVGNGYVNLEPEWSPDGFWIAFSSDRDGDYNVYVMDSRGEEYGLYQITTSTADDYEPTWSPDGTQIAFTSLRSGNGDIYIASNLGLPTDRDGDGLADALDACPFVAPGPGEIDRDYDGCPDETSSFRMIRFHDDADLPFTYETDAIGHPDIAGSDFTELQAAFDTWTAIPGLAFSGAGGDDGSRAGPSNPVSGDGRNSISFVDEDGFLFGTIAITPTAVATGDTTIGTKTYRAGEVIDADILFNTRDFTFSTPTHNGGPSAFDLRSVAVHEFGHALGFAHSPLERSTMFYVVVRGNSVASLEDDDIVLARRGYGSPQLTIEGRVLFPNGVDPVVGAAVYAITASGDSTQMTFSGMDGTYRLYDLTEDFRVYVQPLDGSASVNGLSAGAVNAVLAQNIDLNFLPEFLDNLESNGDLASSGSIFSPSGAPITGADIILNEDQFAPQVAATYPVDGEMEAGAVGALLVEFDEKLSESLFALSPDISLRNMQDSSGVGGVASLLHYGDRLAFTPSAPLAYDTDYQFTIGPDLQDLSGNPMSGPVFVDFRTQSRPTVLLESLSPPEVPLGGVVLIYGEGFDPDPAGNLVEFEGAAPVQPVQATLDRLTVVVPAHALPGDVKVTVGPEVSNGLYLEVLPPRSLPVGNAIGATTLTGTVRKVAISPAGFNAYVATSDGIVAIDADPSSPTFLQRTTIPLSGGANDVAFLPTGDVALAISSSPNTLTAIDTGTSSLIQQVPLAGEPLNMSVVPGGTEVVITYADRVVLHSAVPGPTFGAELKQWSSAEYGFLGNVAVSPSGDEIYVTTTDGKVATLGTAPEEGILQTVDAGTDPQEIVVLADGSGFVVADAEGTIRLYGTQGDLLDTEIVEGGFSGLSMSPEGNYVFGANLIINSMEIMRLEESSLIPENEFATGIDPQDCVTGPAGRFVFAITGEGSFEVYDTQVGPRIDSVSPPSGGPGTLITIAGSGFDPVLSNNSVRIGSTGHVPVSGSTSRLVIVQDAAAQGRTIVVEAGNYESNAARYAVVNRADPGNFFDAGTLSTGTGIQLSHLAESPNGEMLIGRYVDGSIQVMRAAPGQPGLLRPVQDLNPSETGLSTSGPMVFSNDGKKLYAVDGAAFVAVFKVIPGASDPLTRMGSVESGGVTASLLPDELVMTADGRRLLVRSEANGSLYEVDAAADTVLGATTSFTAAPLSMAIDPRGGVAYVGDSGTGPVIDVVDIDPASAGYRTVIATVSLGGAAPPVQLASSPDGAMLYAVALSAGTDFQLEVVDISAGPGPVVQTVPFPGQTTAPVVLPSRSGTVLYYLTTSTPFEVSALQVGPFALVPGPAPDPGLAQAGNLVQSRDDARLYAAVGGDALKILDVATTTGLQAISGFDQIAVAGEELPAPFVARVTGSNPTLAAGGVVRFSVDVGNGDFGYPDKQALAAADDGGFVTSFYTAGPTPGQDEISVSAAGLQLTRFITTIDDTTGAPPAVIAVRPSATSENPGVNTRIAVDFSKSIDPATVSTSTFQVQKPGESPLAGYFTFADDLRRAVFTPSGPLDPSTAYEIELTAAIADGGAVPLSNPGVTTFVTDIEPPLTLTSVYSPSGKIGIPVILSGTGFDPDPALNTALFNGIQGEITGSDPGALFAKLPYGVPDGPISVTVATGPDTSNAIPFVVLNPLPAPINNVTGILDVPSSGQRIAITPDGTRAYMTSREAGAVVPILVDQIQAEDPIPTGVEPFGIAISPDGARAYVTNFGSNTISVIGTDPDNAAEFHQVIATIPTAANPTAIAVHPDGRTLYVVHYGEPVLNIFDVDPSNANEFRARSQVDTGSTSKAVKVTPDGGLVVVGTASGILVLNSGDGSARSSTDTGGSVKAVEVTPDGGLALVLTELDELILIDIAPGSPTEGRARSSSSTAADPKDVKVSPDGGFAYVTHDGGFVAVYALDILAGEGASESEGLTTPYRIILVDTIQVGENPRGLAIDPSGSGLILVVNSGDNTVTFINGSEQIVYTAAQVDIDPNVLNLQSNGQYVYANLQFVDFLDPADLVLSSVLFEDAVPADTTYSLLVDDNGDGILENRVRFSRLEAFQVIPEGESVPLRVSGMIDDNYFAGEDSLRIIRPKRIKPGPNDTVVAGSETEIGWEPIKNNSNKINRVDILFSGNGGNSWHTLGAATEDDSTFNWIPPDTTSSSCLLLLVARDSTEVDTTAAAMSEERLKVEGVPVPGISGYGGLDMPFAISSVTSTEPGTLPLRFAMGIPRPNPSIGATSILFDLPRAQKVTIRIFGIDGSLVRELESGTLYPPGRHAVPWDGKNQMGQRVGVGVYFVRVHAGKNEATRKITRIQ